MLLQKQLKIGILLADSDDKLLADGLKDLVDIFGGPRGLFALLARCAESPQIDAIHQLLKALKVNHDQKVSQSENQKSKINETGTEEAFADCETLVKKQIRVAIGVDSLPIDSLHHICGFLPIASLEELSKVTRRICIASLEELSKVTLCVLDATSIMRSNRFLCRYYNTAFSSTRHNAMKRMLAVQQDWAERYGVATQNQLVAVVSSLNERSRPYLLDLQAVRLSPISSVVLQNPHRFLLFDFR